MDDLLLMCNNTDLLQELKHVFLDRFAIQDMGEAEFILGIQIEKLETGIWIGQPLYAKGIL